LDFDVVVFQLGCARSPPDASVTLRSNGRFAPIVLQKSKVAPVRIFVETLKLKAIDDSNNLSRITEVAHEFCVRR
jgi:hypothetical protein